jgi:hypothetical protein
MPFIYFFFLEEKKKKKKETNKVQVALELTCLEFLTKLKSDTNH